MNIHPFLSSTARAFLSALFFVTAVSASLQAQRMSLNDPKAAPVVVESATISAEVTGRIAVTTFDLVFRNPNARVLEGTFEFPLLDQQSVVSFGLDINGRLREAVPVEKNRGRVVFEEIERRGVDPALLEKTVGNNYRARVYPIPAHGTRRVVIAYQEDLSLKAGDSIYRLALNFPTPLENFQLSINVPATNAALAKVKTTLPLELPAWREAKYFEVKQTRFTAQGVFEVELPPIEYPQILTERRNNKEYFYAEVPLPASKPVARPNPSVVGLLWDASGSGRNRDHKRELALLDAWFDAVRDVEVRLIPFRDRTTAPIPFKVVRGDWSKLRRELEKIVYDGGTGLDGLVDDPAVGEWLLFSDGLLNFGVTQTATKLPLRAPVHIVLAGSQANPALLRGIAQRQGGEYVNLLDTPAETAAAFLRHESLRLLATDYDPEQIAQVFPGTNTPVHEGRLIVTGILRTPSSTIRLSLGHNSSDAWEIQLPLHSGENPSHLAARAWATTKIANLESDQAANREDIRHTSQEFGIVTADTSLIVLETLQDYLRYDIAPPEELRADWDANRRSQTENNWKGRTDKLTRIAQLFAAKVKWWETKFYPEGKSSSDLTASPPLAANMPAVSPAPAAIPVRANTPIESLEKTDELLVLSPFVVTADAQIGYQASSTLAGTRLRTELSDIGGSITVNASAGLSDNGARADEESGEAHGSSSITLKRWEPAAGYLDRLRQASPKKRYSVYLEERADHRLQPGFFLDVAEFFFGKKEDEIALRILSNLAELQLDDPALLRVLAHRLVQAGHSELAQPLFERVLVLRPEEPQSKRDLALVCSTLKEYQRAINLLWQIVAEPSDNRFPEIELIALGELNAIVATCGEKLDLSQIDARLLQNLPVGLRVVLTWDADACDIDLWVTDPHGEKAVYDHPRTAQGGRMSSDFTGGYGPEEFLLRNPATGKYTVRINYFGDHRQTGLGPVTAQIRLITGFGTPAEKEQRLTVRLSETNENLAIGEIEIGN